MTVSKNPLYCSFCAKSEHDVRKMIAGPTVFICDECVELCNGVIRGEHEYALLSEEARAAKLEEQRLAYAALVFVKGFAKRFGDPYLKAGFSIDDLVKFIGE